MDFNEKDIKKEFGENVRYYRKLKKITQFKLADMVGKSEETISNIERGVPSTGIELVYKIATALDVQIEQLFDRNHIKTSNNLDIEKDRLSNEIIELLKPKNEKFIKHLIGLLQE